MFNGRDPYQCNSSGETGLENYILGGPRQAGPLVVNPDVVPVIDGVGVDFDPLTNDQGTGLFISALQGAAYIPGTPIFTPGGGLLTSLPNRKTLNYIECTTAPTTDTSNYTAKDVAGKTGTANITFNISPRAGPAPIYYKMDFDLFRFAYSPVLGNFFLDPIGTAAINYNAIGYYPGNNTLYGNDGGQAGNLYVAIDTSTGVATSLGTYPNIAQQLSGDFDSNNNKSVINILPLVLTPPALYVFDFNGINPPNLVPTVGNNIIVGVAPSPATVGLDVAFNPIADGFYNVDAGTGNVWFGTMNYGTGNATWNVAAPLGIFPTGTVSGSAASSSLGNMYFMTIGTGIVWAAKSTVPGVISASRVVGTVPGPTNGFFDAAANSLLPVVLDYPYVVLDRVNALGFTECLDYPHLPPQTYSTPQPIADASGVIDLFTPEGLLDSLLFVDTTGNTDDSFSLSGPLPAGLTGTAFTTIYNGQLVPAFEITGIATNVVYTTAMKLVDFSTTSIDTTPRYINVTARTSPDELESFVPSVAILYIQQS